MTDPAIAARSRDAPYGKLTNWDTAAQIGRAGMCGTAQECAARTRRCLGAPQPSRYGIDTSQAARDRIDACFPSARPGMQRCEDLARPARGSFRTAHPPSAVRLLMRGTVASRTLWRLLALLALAATIELTAPAGEAWAGFGDDYTDGYEGDGDDGPGTRWRACRDEAWADYNECLMQDPDDWGNRTVCYWLWDFDAPYCAWTLIVEMA